MGMIRNFILIFSVFVCTVSFPQASGDNIYDFLNLTNSARIAGLGGKQIAIFDDDLNLAYQNPSLLNGSMSNHLVLNYIPYIGDINFGYVSYARTYNKIGNLGAGIHYIDYGKFTGADEYGNLTGNFGAHEYSVNLYYAKPVFDSLLNVGATLKLIDSQLETYSSFGMGIDAGISYVNSNKLFCASFVMKNLGIQLSKYYEGADREPQPFELQLGISQKLQHAPFRFAVTLQHLESPNLRYETEKQKEDDNVNELTGEIQKEDKLANFTDNVMRHVIIGLEFIPSKHINVQFGYNYKRRQEMKIENAPGFVGFSWGFGLKLKNFTFNYSRARYHVAAVSNQLSLCVNLSGFKK
jgi:hypothetical protein